MSDVTYIDGEYCKHHSTLYGWDIYRAWNLRENHGKMRYFAVRDKMSIEAKNLSGIKDRIRREVGRA